jgi:hypothetical protein
MAVMISCTFPVPSLPTGDDVPVEVFAAAMDETTDTWLRHLAVCPHHCWCARSPNFCASPPTAEDLLCDRCRRNHAEPDVKTGRLLCAIFAHDAPFRPEQIGLEVSQ